MDASGACPPAADVGAAVGAQCAQCGRAALHRHTLWHRAAPRGLPQPPVSAGGLNLVAHLVGYCLIEESYHDRSVASRPTLPNVMKDHPLHSTHLSFRTTSDLPFRVHLERRSIQWA